MAIIGFNRTEIISFQRSLGEFQHVLEEDWKILKDRWEDLKLSWDDKQYASFEAFFEDLSDQYALLEAQIIEHYSLITKILSDTETLSDKAIKAAWTVNTIVGASSSLLAAKSEAIQPPNPSYGPSAKHSFVQSLESSDSDPLSSQLEESYITDIEEKRERRENERDLLSKVNDQSEYAGSPD